MRIKQPILSSHKICAVWSDLRLRRLQSLDDRSQVGLNRLPCWRCSGLRWTLSGRGYTECHHNQRQLRDSVASQHKNKNERARQGPDHSPTLPLDAVSHKAIGAQFLLNRGKTSRAREGEGSTCLSLSVPKHGSVQNATIRRKGRNKSRARNDEPIGVSATGSGFPLVSGYGDLIG